LFGNGTSTNGMRMGKILGTTEVLKKVVVAEEKEGEESPSRAQKEHT